MKQLISPGENKVPALEGKNINKSKAEWHEMASSGKNVEATGTEIDTRLTRLDSPNVRAACDALRVLREKRGADSVVGRHCTTLLSQLRNLPNYARPAWATHESQTLPGGIKWQMAQLERALLA